MSELVLISGQQLRALHRCSRKPTSFISHDTTSTRIFERLMTVVQFMGKRRCTAMFAQTNARRHTKTELGTITIDGLFTVEADTVDFQNSDPARRQSLAATEAMRLPHCLNRQMPRSKRSPKLATRIPSVRAAITHGAAMPDVSFVTYPLIRGS